MVAVPNLVPQSWQTATISEEEAGAAVNSDACFGLSYPGCSTRKVLVEERNEYCGPYNVLVITDR